MATEQIHLTTVQMQPEVDVLKVDHPAKIRPPDLESMVHLDLAGTHQDQMNAKVATMGPTVAMIGEGTRDHV
jgi:hypothetical protein